MICYSYLDRIKFKRNYLMLFIDNSSIEIIKYTQEVLNYSAVFMIPLGAIFVYRNVLQGLGDSFVPMMSCVYEQ